MAAPRNRYTYPPGWEKMLTFSQGEPVQKLLIVSIVAVGFFGAPALAADFPIKAPAYNASITAPPYNWSGFYVGASIGGAWTSGSLNIPSKICTAASPSSSAASRPAIMFKPVTFYLASKVISIGRVLIIRPYQFRHWVL